MQNTDLETNYPTIDSTALDCPDWVHSNFA